MTKQLWINLPVQNVAKAKAFFTHLGFSANPHYQESEESACLLVGEQSIVVMLFQEATFKTIAQSPVSEAKGAAEVLFSFDAESKEEVDELAARVEQAGGHVFAKPSLVAGWMYGCAFSDLDGHRWNILHMDMAKMPQR